MNRYEEGMLDPQYPPQAHVRAEMNMHYSKIIGMKPEDTRTFDSGLNALVAERDSLLAALRKIITICDSAAPMKLFEMLGGAVNEARPLVRKDSK